MYGNRPTIVLRVILCLLLPPLGHGAQAPDDADYSKQIEDVQKQMPGLREEIGRDAVVDRYRAMINAHPGHPKNIEVEMLIANLYECGGRRDPQDLPKAYETYLSIAQRYDSGHPLVRQAKLFAADRSADIYPKKSADLYKKLLDEYPDDDIVTLTCYCGLGLNAWKRGDRKEAEDYYSLVLMYDPLPDKSLPRRTRSTIAMLRNNSAAGLFNAMVDARAPAAIQLEQINRLLTKYPAVGFLRGELISEHSLNLERRMQRELQELAAEALVPAPPPSAKTAGRLSKPPRATTATFPSVRKTPSHFPTPSPAAATQPKRTTAVPPRPKRPADPHRGMRAFLLAASILCGGGLFLLVVRRYFIG